MEKLTLKAGGRELLLRYDLQMLCDVEDEYGSLDDLLDKMEGKERPTTHALFMIACAANAGERHRSGAEDVTTEWLKENLSPRQQREASAMARFAIMLGMRREYAADDDGDVDEVLEEIRKKKDEKNPAE